MKNTTKITVSCQIDFELNERLNKLMEKEMIEKSKIIRKALNLYADRNLGIKK